MRKFTFFLCKKREQPDNLICPAFSDDLAHVAASGIQPDTTKEKDQTEIPQNVSVDQPAHRVFHSVNDPDMAQKVLELFGLSSNESRLIHGYYSCKENSCVCLGDKQQKVNAALKRDRFQHQWMTQQNLAFDSTTGIWWLIFKEDGDETDSGGMFCYLCKKHNTYNHKNKTKVFNENPAKRFKTDALKEHASSKQHSAAVETEMLSRVSVFQREHEEGEKYRDEVLINAFTSIYWLAKNEIANRKFLSLLELLEIVGLDKMKHFKHRSEGITAELFLTLGQVLKDEVVKNVQTANAFGLLVDEVTDISVLEQLLGFVQYVDQDGCAVVNFFFVDNVLKDSLSANAETISRCICENIQNCELDIQSLSSIVTDGATVMTGCRNGVAARLKQLNSKMINVHCICHRLALACADASDEIQYIAQVEGILTRLWKFFAYSTKRSGVLVKTQEEWQNMSLSGKERRVVAKKVKKACRTRWLSINNAVQAVYDDFVPIIQALISIKAVDDRDGMPSYLIDKLNNYKFIGAIYILHAVLPHLSAMSKAFQKGSVNFAHIAPTIDYTLNKLNDIALNHTPLKQLQTDLDDNARLSSLGFIKSDHVHRILHNLLNKYICSLKENISNRFQESLPVLSAFAVFNPNAVPQSTSPEFASYGLNEMVTLCAHYFPGESEAQEAKVEWEKLKYDLLSWKKHMPQDLGDITPTEWALKRLLRMRSEYGYFYPKLVLIADIIMSIPVSNAWPERGASAVKRIKSRLRSSMSNSMLGALLQIAINGPAVSDAKKIITKAVEVWKSKKKRRNLPPRSATGTPATDSSAAPPVVVVDAAVQVDMTANAQESEEAKKLDEEVGSAIAAFNLLNETSDSESDEDF